METSTNEAAIVPDRAVGLDAPRVFFPHVIRVVVLRPYQVILEFNDGRVGIVDLESELWGEVFEPLTDPDYFLRIRVDEDTIMWPNDANFAPEFLYEEAGKHPLELASAKA